MVTRINSMQMLENIYTGLAVLGCFMYLAFQVEFMFHK